MIRLWKKNWPKLCTYILNRLIDFDQYIWCPYFVSFSFSSSSRERLSTLYNEKGVINTRRKELLDAVYDYTRALEFLKTDTSFVNRALAFVEFGEKTIRGIVWICEINFFLLIFVSNCFSSSFPQDCPNKRGTMPSKQFPSIAKTKWPGLWSNRLKRNMDWKNSLNRTAGRWDHFWRSKFRFY